MIIPHYVAECVPVALIKAEKHKNPPGIHLRIERAIYMRGEHGSVYLAIIRHKPD